jgi:hypothetical protein
MNERIDKLVEQSITQNESGWPDFRKALTGSGSLYLHVFAEEFAELIVEDTINILKQEWYDLNNTAKVEGETPRDIGMRVGAKSQTIRLIHKIEKHFGVEK